MPEALVPVGVRLRRDQIERLTADGQKLGEGVRKAIDAWPPPIMGATEAAAELGVATGNLEKVPGLPEPLYVLRRGKLYEAAKIRALAAAPPRKVTARRTQRPPGPPPTHCQRGHELAGNTNAAGRCKRCEVERVRAYKQARKARANAA